jgi:hypothetical protein
MFELAFNTAGERHDLCESAVIIHNREDHLYMLFLYVIARARLLT